MVYGGCFAVVVVTVGERGGGRQHKGRWSQHASRTADIAGGISTCAHHYAKLCLLLRSQHHKPIHQRGNSIPIHNQRQPTNTHHRAALSHLLQLRRHPPAHPPAHSPRGHPPRHPPTDNSQPLPKQQSKPNTRQHSPPRHTLPPPEVASQQANPLKRRPHISFPI